MGNERFNGIFGRPFETASPDDENVYARVPTISPHPGWYDDADLRKGERLNERQMPPRDKQHPRKANKLYNSIGMDAGDGNLFGVEDARASVSITPAAANASQTALVTLDRDLILDGGMFPSTEPGAAIYLGVRDFSVSAVAATATGAIAWSLQIGNGPFLSLGTTLASPSNHFVGVAGFVPFPLPPDRILQGTSIGLLLAVSDTVALPVALRATLGFSILFSIPYER